MNSAGIKGEIRQTAECSKENWNHIIAINLTGVWLCMKHELAYVLPPGEWHDCEHSIELWAGWVSGDASLFGEGDFAAQ